MLFLIRTENFLSKYFVSLSLISVLFVLNILEGSFEQHIENSIVKVNSMYLFWNNIDKK